MSEMQQGEEYIEEDLDEFVDDESSEDTDAPIDLIAGIPKNYVYIGGVVLLVIILLVIVVTTRKTKSKEEDIVLPQQNEYYQQAVDTTFYEEPIVETVQEPVEPEYEVGEIVNGFMWDGTTWVNPEPAISLEDNKRLRAAGYTGDEIDYALKNGFDVESLIAASQELYDKEAKEALQRMSDTASPEFLYIIDNTYFSQVGYEFVPQKELPLSEQTIVSNSFVVNADYVKCPTYGSQLQLKCKVASDLYVWLILTPQRWEQLPDAGNIVLRVYYTEYGPNRYVTDVKEVDSSLDTIDTAENTSSLEEIIDEEVEGSIESTD